MHQRSILLQINAAIGQPINAKAVNRKCLLIVTELKRFVK